MAQRLKSEDEQRTTMAVKWWSPWSKFLSCPHFCKLSVHLLAVTIKAAAVTEPQKVLSWYLNCETSPPAW